MTKQESSLSRRRFLQLTGAAAAVPILAACSTTPSAQPATTPAPGTGTQQAAATPKRGGSLVSAWTWTYPTLDPHISTMATYSPNMNSM